MLAIVFILLASKLMHKSMQIAHMASQLHKTFFLQLKEAHCGSVVKF